MSRQTANKWFWLTVAAVVCGFSILTWAIFTRSVSVFEIVGWLTGAVLPVFFYLLNHLQRRSVSIFLLSHRVRSFLNPKILNWNLTVNLYARNLSPDVIERIISKLMEVNKQKKDLRIKRINQYNAIIEIPSGPNLDILYSPAIHTIEDSLDEKNQSYIQIFINNYRVGHRQADYAIKREIMPALDVISDVVHTTDSQYKLVVDFDKNNNPYFSLYVAQLPAQAVSNFFVRLTIDSYEPNSTILVSESKISIDTRSKSALQNLALEFLTFDQQLQEHLRHA